MRFRVPSRKSLIVAGTALVGAGAIAGGIAAIVITMGFAPISARPADSPILYNALHTAFKSTTARLGADVTVPDDIADPGRVALGMQHYANVCTSCHGGPGLGQSPVALSMRPKPQHLPAVVDQFTDEQLYVILRDGVQFSAMPAWPAEMNYDEIWSMVAFLRQLPGMTAQDYLDGTQRVAPAGAPLLQAAAQDDLHPMRVGIPAEPAEEYLYAAPGTGWRNYGDGGDLIATCSACHGDDGTGSATGGRAPNLTIPSEEYIAQALYGYASGDRPSGVMTTIAASLTDDQIDGLAAYYASLPDLAAPTDQASVGDPAAGEQIAVAGLPALAIPACQTCHQAPDGSADGNVERGEAEMIVPAIAGQSETYMRQRLVAFALDGWSSGQVWQPMGYIGHNLTEQQRADLAAYYARLPVGSEQSIGSMQPLDRANAVTLAEQVCKECHTETGIGSPSGEYPNLTLQTPEYLALQLYAFKGRQRESERMAGVVDRLSDKDMSDLAQYFGTAAPQQSPPPVEPFADAITIAAGGRIAVEGLPDRNIPACLDCHSDTASSRLPIIARLNGQAPRYIEDRLQALGSHLDTDNRSLNPMHTIARDMTQDERHAVAAWFATQPVLAKQ